MSRTVRVYYTSGLDLYAKPVPLSDSPAWLTDVVSFAENGSLGEYSGTVTDAAQVVFVRAGVSPASTDYKAYMIDPLIPSAIVSPQSAIRREVGEETPIHFTFAVPSLVDGDFTKTMRIDGGAEETVNGTITYLYQVGNDYWYQLSYNADDRPANKGLVKFTFTDGTRISDVELTVGGLTPEEVNTQVDTALSDYDPPTYAEMVTLIATVTDALAPGAVIQSPVPSATLINLIAGDTYDGSSSPKLTWTVTKDYTGNDIQLVLHNSDATTIYGRFTGAVDSSTSVSVSMDAVFDTEPTYTSCSSKAAIATIFFALVSVDGAGDEETIARGTCLVTKRGAVLIA